MKPGLSQLRNAADLLEKLRWEFKNLEAHPADAYHAFNFFVTAEHMADWTNNILLRKTIPLLRITSHIACGGTIDAVSLAKQVLAYWEANS